MESPVSNRVLCLTWMPYLALAFGGYIFTVSIYRLLWHPLARYPGPLLGRITDWYSVYHAVKGDRFLDFYILHSKYGEVVRFGPNRISINSPEGLRAIYGTQANTQKSRFYNVFNHFFDAPSTETAIDKSDHARKRRILSRALSDKALKDMEGAVLENFQRFHDLLAVPVGHEDSSHTIAARNGWSQPKDMARLMDYLTFDIMGDICFSKNFETLISAKNRDLISVISDGAQGLNTVGHMPGILKLRVERLLLPRLIRGLDKYKECSKILAESCIKNHSSSLAGPRNVVQFLLNKERRGEKVEDEEFSTAELISEISLLIIAGSDTTSNALANTLFHLLNNPATLATLVTEIDGTFESVNDIVAGKKLSGCSYLCACIDESLRLNPPVGGLLSREVLPGGLQIGERSFPAGIDIGTPHYALQHSAEIFHNPYAFEPQRWITDSGAKSRDVEIMRSAFCAFSIGTRGCVGKRMAYMELTTVLARLVWLCEMRLATRSAIQAAGESTMNTETHAEATLWRRDQQTTDKFVSRTQGPWVEFRARRH